MKFKAVLQINSGVAIIAENVWTWGADQYGTFVGQCRREAAWPWGSDGGFKCIVIQEWALLYLESKWRTIQCRRIKFSVNQKSMAVQPLRTAKNPFIIFKVFRSDVVVNWSHDHLKIYTVCYLTPFSQPDIFYFKYRI